MWTTWFKRKRHRLRDVIHGKHFLSLILLMTAMKQNLGRVEAELSSPLFVCSIAWSFQPTPTLLSALRSLCFNLQFYLFKVRSAFLTLCLWGGFPPFSSFLFNLGFYLHSSFFSAYCFTLGVFCLQGRLDLRRFHCLLLLPSDGPLLGFKGRTLFLFFLFLFFPFFSQFPISWWWGFSVFAILLVQLIFEVCRFCRKVNRLISERCGTIIWRKNLL